MSIVLAERLRDHLVLDSLTDGYTVKFYRWSDSDLQGSGQVMLFRVPGSAGLSDAVAQMKDVTISILADQDQVRDAGIRMLAIERYLRANYSGVGFFNCWPIANHSGPFYTNNNRARFDLTVRMQIIDH